MNRDWKALTETVHRRQAVAQVVLNAILQKIPANTRAGADLLVEFSIEDLLAAIKQDMALYSVLKDPLAAVERELDFLHEQNIITLQQGLAVFRQAMTIKVAPEAKSRRSNKGDYEPLSQHYGERIFQVHVMNEYAHKALEKIGQALVFVLAYFSLDKTEFIKRYFKERGEFLERECGIDQEAPLIVGKQRYGILGLADLDLSYAGRLPESHPVHYALANLSAGSPVVFAQHNGQIIIQNSQRVTISRLSKKGRQYWQGQLNKIQSAVVMIMVNRYSSDNDKAFQPSCKVEQWEVPMVEVVLRIT